MNTLKSLSSLLNSIVSMVIKDEIADHIEQSVNSIKKALVFLNEGKIERAFFESKTAFSSSGKI
jgi:hypothetical protein